MERLRLFFALFIIMLFTACSTPPMLCTMIGCGDGVTITIPGLILPHNYILTIDNMTYDSCLDTERKGGYSADYKFFPSGAYARQLIIHHGDADIVGGNQTSIDLSWGSNNEPGLPSRMHITISGRDTCSSSPTPLLDREVDVTYLVIQPNGPRCEPTCRQASITL